MWGLQTPFINISVHSFHSFFEEDHTASFSMARPSILFFTLLILSFTTFSFAKPRTITLPLSPVFSKSQDLLHTLKLTASASLSRALHLKRHRFTNPPLNTSVSAKGYGGYSIDLSFGTPPQTSSFILDTGSSLVWFPCSSRYLCSDCNFPNIDPAKIPTFIPRNSSTSKLLGCGNPKCGYLFGPDLKSRCRGCNPESQNCNLTCPAYILEYGLGSTSGFLLLENLDFPGKIVPEFLVGCSILSVRQPSGIAGFGRGIESLPTQLGLKKFSHCLLSHRFDDAPQTSDLILQIDSTGDTKTPGLSYTPFGKNPTGNNTAFLQYYYVTLKKILVGGERVKIPLSFLVPEESGEGNGGTIVDSGSTFTFMERPVFDLVAKEFEKQLSNFTRAKDVEAQIGLNLCFNFTGAETVPFPELTFQFKGGAKMTLPLTNYFSLVEDSEIACLTIVSGDSSGTARASGPAIILGNYQQQNFNVEYDLENDRFGFGPQNCEKSA